MPIDLRNIEDAATALRYAVSKKTENCYLEATCASGDAGDPQYYRYVALTQRIVKNDVIVGYVCYRTKVPKKDERVVFSSYEIFGADFDRMTSVKVHLDTTITPRETFDTVLDFVLNKLQ